MNSIIPNFYFEGAKPELDGVLTVRTEKVKKKIPYQVFKDKLTNYIMTNLDVGKYIHILIFHLKGPF